MTTYVMTGQTAYAGPWAASLAECAQNAAGFKPAKAKFIADQILAGTIVSGDRVLLDASIGGPLKLIDAQDFAVNTRAATAPIPLNTNNMPTSGGLYGRNIVFGDRIDNNVAISKARGIAFHATGTSGFNVDMTGIEASGDFQNRQLAAILIQGDNLDVTGWRIKPSDWNYLATGRIDAASGLGGTTFAVRASYENIGLLVRGAWNSKIYGNYVEGSNFTTYGILVGVYCKDDVVGLNQGKYVEVYDNEAKYCGAFGVYLTYAEGNGYYVLPAGARCLFYRNTASDARFVSLGANNAGMARGKLVGTELWPAGGVNPNSGALVNMYDCEAYGEAQDGMSCGFLTNIYDNYIHDIAPAYAYGATYTPLEGVAAGSTASGYATGWDFRTRTIEGNGLKLGLTGLDGTPGAGWLVPGTPNVTAYFVDEVRNRVFRNRINYVPGYSVTSNNSSGMLICANEMIQDSRSAGGAVFGLSARTGSTANQWLANNYIKGPTHGGFIGDNNRVYFFNNAIDAPSSMFQLSGTGSSVTGRQNVSTAAIAYVSGATSAQTASLTGTVTAVPAYTAGIGPTAGGNCDAKGDVNGLLGARTPFATARALGGGRWKQTRLPIGPRQL